MDFSDLDSMFGDPSKEVKVLRELVEKLMELVITAMGEIETRFLAIEERLGTGGPSGAMTAPSMPVAPPTASLEAATPPPAPPAGAPPVSSGGTPPPPPSAITPPAPAAADGLPPPPPAAPGGLPPPPAPGGLQSDLSSAIQKRQTPAPGGMPPPPAPGGVPAPPAPGGGGFGGLQPPPAQQPSAPPPGPSGGLGLQAALKSELAEAFKKIRANLDEE